MAEAISLPPGAFAAMKSGAPQPKPAEAPKPAADAPKADAKPKGPEIVRKPAPSLREADKPEPRAEPPKDLTPAERKIWKLKADGEEFDFDATDEEAVKREIMKARGSEKRFRAAQETKAEAERAFAMLKDPDGLKRVLADPRIGLDVKKFAEQVVWEQIQQEQREADWRQNPEKKKQYEDEQELQARRAADERTKAEGLTRQQQEAQGRYETGYSEKIMKALEAGNMPKTPEAVARMAEYLYRAVEHGYDLSPDDLVQQVRDDYINEFKAVLGGSDGDQLLALLGEENADKLRKADLKRLKSPQGNPFPTRSPQRQAASDKPIPREQRKSGSEWRDGLMKDFLNRNR